MRALPGRCIAVLAFALVLNGLGLAVLGALLGAPPNVLALLRLLGVVLGAAALAAWALHPMSTDLDAIAVLAERSGNPGAPTAPARAPMRAAESAALLDSLLLVLARSRELQAVQQQARRSLEEAEQLRVSFVAAMAHDLRGPLNSVIGFSDLLLMEGQDAVAPAQRPSVELIRRGGQDLLALLDQILDWARLEAGQLKLEPRPTDLAEVLQAVAVAAAERSAERGLTLALEVAEGLPPLQADPARLAEALLGLIDHATRAPDRPRISVRARLAESSEQARPGRCLQVELHDPQLRVRAADLDSFFEAFRPSYAPSGRRLAGLGLGPALGRALIRAHGGQVWFASHAETGSTFKVELPLRADPAAGPGPGGLPAGDG